MQIGVVQTLTVLEAVPGGFMVGDRDGQAFLAGRGVPFELEIGLSVDVFVYHDAEGKPLATTETPLVQAGQYARLRVVDVAEHGAYLDWGLPRDLFVPRALQHQPLEVGDRTVVAVDVDDRGRVFGATKLVDTFDSAVGALRMGDAVQLMVYGFNERGALVVVDGRYTGLVYHNENYRSVLVGDTLAGWVREVRSDGRVDVVLQRPGRGGTLDAREVIWEALQTGDGFLDLTDRSDPGLIRSRLRMSKKAFKKAVGSLYRDRKIRIDPDGLRIVREE